MAVREDTVNKSTIVVTPNCSLSIKGAAVFFASVSFVCLSVAGVFVSLGFWPVLPFAGMELFILGLALGLSLRRGHSKQIIEVTDHQVTVISTRGNRTEQIEFPRPWARVGLVRPARHTSPSRLFVQHGRERFYIAGWLTESERRGLFTRLAELIGPVKRSPELRESTTGSG